MRDKTILYAPNIHVGGGMVLLSSLLKSFSPEVIFSAFLDERARNQLVLPLGVKVHWVKATIISRLVAEFILMKTSKRVDCILCFHGLPPLMPINAKVLVFLQNRNFLGLNTLSEFKFKTKIRLYFERFICNRLRYRVDRYIVQTPSMFRDVREWYLKLSGVVPKIDIIPFVEKLTISSEKINVKKNWDFIYVADGEGHKNHINLLRAWKILSTENIKPSLALTLSSRDQILKNLVFQWRENFDLNVFDLGEMSQDNLVNLYLSAGAMVYPSKSESFGLPLIEATQLGLPIVASELDFVRDVCEPKHTFDPESPISIARAVKRFIGVKEEPLRLLTSKEFCESIA
jgi:glycosyltransferase involved in cell wall biosynthesis